MRRAILLLLLLGACSAGGSPAEEQCKARAYDDPDVKDALLLSNSQQQQIRGPALLKLDALVKEKTRLCLGAQGLGPRGGVQPVLPY